MVEVKKGPPLYEQIYDNLLNVMKIRIISI